MKRHNRTIALLLAAALMILTSACALAKSEVQVSKVIEESKACDYGTIRVTVDQWCQTYGKKALRYFVAHIYTSDPSQLQTAFAGEKYSKSAVEAPSDIAARHDAVIAINGDYYNYKDNVGLVIRNGELYRDAGSTRDQLLIYADGTFGVVRPQDYQKNQGETYIEAGVVQSLMFGPLLVDNHEIVELPKDYIISTKETTREPRTAIGQVDEGHYVMIVADGRRDGWSDEGMTLQELAQVFVEEGCRIGYNLDGGGSATMVLDGERVNRGSASRERDVSDIVYFTK